MLWVIYIPGIGLSALVATAKTLNYLVFSVSLSLLRPILATMIQIGTVPSRRHGNVHPVVECVGLS